jgi:hypothetical protein
MHLLHLVETEKGNANQAEAVQMERTEMVQAGVIETAAAVRVWLVRREVLRLTPAKGKGQRAVAEQGAKAEIEIPDHAKGVVKEAVEAKRVKNAADVEFLCYYIISLRRHWRSGFS